MGGKESSKDLYERKKLCEVLGKPSNLASTYPPCHIETRVTLNTDI